MFRQLIETVRTCAFIESYELLEYVEEESVQFIQLKAILRDGSILHVREFLSLDKSTYSYHWQDAADTLILRWDNAPHHRHISTFPHHLHDRQGVKPSERVFIKEVLREIAKRLD